MPPNGSAFSGRQQRWPDPTMPAKYAARRQPKSIEPSSSSSAAGTHHFHEAVGRIIDQLGRPIGRRGDNHKGKQNRKVLPIT